MLRAALNSGSALAVADQAINSLASFLTTVIMARALGAQDFGTYSLLFVTMLTLNGFVNTVVSEPIRTLGVNAASGSRARYVGAQLISALCVGVAIATLVAATLVIVLRLDAAVAMSVGAAVLTAGVLEAMRALAASRHEWKHVLVGDAITQAAKLGALFVLMEAGHASVGNGYWVLAAAAAAGALAFFTLGAKPAPPGRDFLFAQVRSHVRYGRWLSLESIVYLLSTQLYMYLIALLVDVKSAGAFAAAQTLINAVNVVWMGITSFSTSTARGILLQQGAEAWRRWLLAAGVWVVGLVALIVMAISLFAQQLMSLLFTAAYAQYAYVVPILAVASILTVINALLSVAFRTIEMPQMGFRGKALSAVVTMLVALPLIRDFGVAGAAFGMIVTQLCWTGVYLWGLRSIRGDWALRIDGIRQAYRIPETGLS